MHVLVQRLCGVTTVAVAAFAQAQNSAVVVTTPGQCLGVFSSVWLSVDGAMEAAVNGGRPNRADNVSPGNHELTVNCFEGFTVKVLASADVDVPPGTELRLRLKGRALEVFGKSPWTAPVVVDARAEPEGPSAEQRREAESFMRDAKADVKDLLAMLDEEDDRCVGKVAAKLELVKEALRGDTAFEAIDDATERLERARSATRGCRTGLARDVEKGLARITKALNRASKALR